MKKIVGLLAAAAVLATSVFAADVAAKVRVGGNIFSATPAANEKGDDATALKLLNADTISHTYDAPFATLSTSTDNAGGTVKFVGDENGLKAGDVQVWFKPIDVLKIQAGSHDLCMNKETIDWTEHHGEQAYATYGYSLGFAQDAISANIAFGTDDNGWFFEDSIAKYGSTEEPACAYVKDLFANFAYGADFGTISAFFRYRGKSVDGINEAMKGDFSKLKYNPTQINFGAAYKNTIDALTFFVNVVGTSKSAATDKEMDLAKLYALAQLAAGKSGDDLICPGIVTDKDGKARSVFGLGVDAFVQYSADALTVKGFVKYDTADFGHLTLKDGEMKEDIMADNNTKVELLARVDYKLDNGIGLFAYFKNANLLYKDKAANSKDKDPSAVFASTIKLGASGSVGIASWETCLQFDTGKLDAKKENFNKVSISMPVWVQVAF
jgi:hypothetical protein